MSLMVVGLLVVVESLVGRLLLGDYRVLMIEHCFVEGVVVFGCKVERLIGSVEIEDVFGVVDL